jgi:hypothetical protein
VGSGPTRPDPPPEDGELAYTGVLEGGRTLLPDYYEVTLDELLEESREELGPDRIRCSDYRAHTSDHYLAGGRWHCRKCG